MGIKDSDIDPENYASIDKFSGIGDASGGDSGSGSGVREIGAGLNDPDRLADAVARATGMMGDSIDTTELRDWLRGVDGFPASDYVSEGSRGVVVGSDVEAARARLTDIVRDGDGYDKVVLTDWLVYCDNLAVLSSWIDELLNAGATVTAVGSDVVLDPDGSLTASDVTALLGEVSAAALDPRDHPGEGIEILRHDWQGRTPIATEVSDRGNLIPSLDYDRVRRHLLDVVEGGESRTWASNRIGCSLRTVSRILDDPERRELYRLPAKGGE